MPMDRQAFCKFLHNRDEIKTLQVEKAAQDLKQVSVVVGLQDGPQRFSPPHIRTLVVSSALKRTDLYDQ